MAQTLTYPVHVTPAEEGGFIVTSPVISIYTQGDTEAKALSNAQEAIICHVEGMARDRKRTPAARVTLLQIVFPDFPAS